MLVDFAPGIAIFVALLIKGRCAPSLRRFAKRAAADETVENTRREKMTERTQFSEDVGLA